MAGRPEPLSRVHPVADLFPMMNATEHAELVASIHEHGQQVPIWTSADGYTLLDGRNRLKACRELGIPVRTEAVRPGTKDEVIIASIAARNLVRRNLSVSQTGMIGARILPIYEAAAAERQRASCANLNKGKTHASPVPVNLPAPGAPHDARDEVAKMTRVSGKTISDAKAVIGSGDTKLIAEVDAGRVPVSRAARTVRKAAVPPAPPDADRQAGKLSRAALSQLDAFAEAYRSMKDLTGLSAAGEKCRQDFLELSALKLAMVDPSS